MFDLLISVASILMLVWASYLIKSPLHYHQKKYILFTRILQTPLIFFGVILFISPSFVIVGNDEVGYLKPRFSFSRLPRGEIIQANGYKTDLIESGIHFMPYVRVLNEVSTGPIVKIKDGHYGILTTIDGYPYSELFPEEWEPNNFKNMLNAKYFLTKGKGKKGKQLTILPPGEYRLHPALYYVEIEKALVIPVNHVAVVRSYAQTKNNCIEHRNTLDHKLSIRFANIVPIGCIGVWEEPLTAGQHYINKLAYKTKIIPFGKQTLTFSGENPNKFVPIKATDKSTPPKYFAGPALSIMFGRGRDALFNVTLDVETKVNEAVTRLMYFTRNRPHRYNNRMQKSIQSTLPLDSHINHKLALTIQANNKTPHPIDNPKKHLETKLLKALKKDPPPFYLVHDVRIDKIISTPEQLKVLLHIK